MIRWRRLSEYLQSFDAPEVTLTYAQIGKLVGGPLRTSAEKWRPQFWANAEGNAYAKRWLGVGFRTNLGGLPGDQVRFVRVSKAAANPAVAATPPQRPSVATADVLLVGCVKTKGAEPARAKELYRSALWLRRRVYAEAAGKPWLILSTEHGLVDPEEVLAPYDRYLTEQPHEYRAVWARRVVAQLRDRFGGLDGMVFELHAGAAYGDPIEPLLRWEQAELRRPLEGLQQGRQLQWYDEVASPERAPASAVAAPRPSKTVPPPVTGVSRELPGPSSREASTSVPASERRRRDGTRCRKSAPSRSCAKQAPTMQPSHGDDAHRRHGSGA